MNDNHAFVVTYAELEKRFNAALNKTLGQIDNQGMFHSLEHKPKMTGVAGRVVETSIVGYDADNKQRADLYVDGQEVELKTTGIRRSKHKGTTYEAKEPMTVTAVSPKEIVNEEFEPSHFWGKIAHMLFAYYLYDSDKTVSASEYANFPLLGYEFFSFTDQERAILKNDWTLVRNFLRQIQHDYSNPEDGYPRLSSELRNQLMFIDTAPKWPNPPRFRLKRSVMNTIVDRYFKRQGEQLDSQIESYSEFDRKLHEFGQLYGGKTVRELLKQLDIKWKPSAATGDVSKAVGEQIVVKMFGGKSTKFKKVELFKEMGLVPKTLTVSKNGGRTEDFKISGMQLPTWTSEDDFYESVLGSFFSDTQLLMIVFQEPSAKAPLLDNKFLGFKRYSFSEEFIQDYVKKLWDDTRNLINENRLVDEKMYDKKGNVRITPKTRVEMSAPNFMKDSDNPVFVRGTGTDAKHKPVEINGVHMYTQDIWVSGRVIVNELKKINFI